jgi:hypothetical protein
MQRNRFFSRRRPPRRGAHEPAFDANCVKLTPPIEAEGFFIGFCGDLQLWRVRLPGFDRHGVIDDDARATDFYEAITEAADTVRDADPELAAKLAEIRRSIESD